ncbi:MAG: SseB family protein [Myxococcales bacterium]
MSHEASLALLHALVAAARDPSHRPKVLTALRGAELWAATWPTDPASLRALTNSQGITALCLFSSERQLEDAAARYAWIEHDGRVPSCLVSLPDALRYAKFTHASMLVVDIAADHVLELDQGEMELLSTLPSTRPPSFEGLSVVSRSRPTPDGLSVKRVSVRPPAPGLGGRETYEMPVEPPRSSLKPSSVTPDPDLQSVSATFGAPPTATMEILEETPSEELFDAFTAVLREYPEVEWACVVQAERGQGRPNPSVALRIEPAFRKHLPEISAKIWDVGGEFARPFEVVVLDSPEQMKQARAVGLPFYPWRKR